MPVVVLAGGLSSCAPTDSWVDAGPALGWPAQYGDAANSSYTTTTGATKLTLEWTRSVKGSLAAAPALSARGYLALNAQTPAGCSLMEWENNNGRQRWCVRLVQGGGVGGPLLDGFDNLYIGQPGAIVAFPVTQWTRWRQPVIGMPTT
ncbi:pyrrolo-quinoline quinone, partial [Mycobacterium simiae]